MNRSLSLILTITTALWASAAGERATVLPVVDVAAGGDGVVELARCEAVGPEAELRVAWGDSVTSVWTPYARYDFATRGDTVLLLGEESRAFRVAFDNGTPALLLPPDACLTSGFTVCGRVHQSEYLRADGVTRVDAPQRVDIVTLPGDTIRGCRLDRSERTARWTLTSDSTLLTGTLPDSMLYVTRVERLMATAPGESLPRYFKKRTVTSYRGEELSADSAAWILTSPPPAAGADASRSRRMEPPSVPDPLAPGDGIDVRIITRESDFVTENTATDAAGLTLTVSDIAGRERLREPLSPGRVTHAPPLPRGEYIISITSGGTVVATAKFVKR